MKKKKLILEEFSGVETHTYTKVNSYRIFIPQAEYPEKRYECKLQQIFSREEDTPLSETNTMIHFIAGKYEDNGKYVAYLQILSIDIDSSNTEAMEFVNLGKLLAIPTQKIIGVLKPNGEIISIRNEKEIFNQWKEVLPILDTQIMNKEFLATLKNTGDEEFSNPLKTINKQLLYILFYLPLFENSFHSGGNRFRYDFSTSSHLVHGEELECRLQEKEVKMEGGTVRFGFEGNCINSEELYKLARKTFVPEADKNGSHQCRIKLEYHLQAEEGYPLWFRYTMKEELPGAFYFDTHLEVKEVTES